VIKLSLFLSKYSESKREVRRMCTISSRVQDLAMNCSSLVKKKNAPEAPPSVSRSLIVFMNDLRQDGEVEHKCKEGGKEWQGVGVCGESLT
jgi:hypothetical protein